MSKDNKYELRVKSMKSSPLAFGKEPQAIYIEGARGEGLEALREARKEVEGLIQLLTARQGEIKNSGDLIPEVVKIKGKLSKKNPKLDSVRRSLEHISKGVAGMGVIAEAVDRIQALLTHLAALPR